MSLLMSWSSNSRPQWLERAAAEAYQIAQAQAAEIAKANSSSPFKAQYRDDPAKFTLDCFRWAGTDKPAPYQLEILDNLAKHKRECARGPHGLGKTALAAWAVLWFALTRDGEDWKIPTTASAWRQLSKFLWPEIHKWTRRLRWDVIGRQPINANEFLVMALKLSTGEAFALASDDPSMIEGAHADNILYIFDESKSIIGATFDAAEGALSTGNAYALAISTPGEPSGRFYDIQMRKPGYTDWHVRHVTLDEAIAAGRISREWANARKEQWNENSAVYQNRVLGEFASSEADGIIPLSWVEVANERWRVWDDSGRPGQVKTIGVDVARSGEDKTCIAILRGNAIEPLRYHSRDDTMVTAGRVAGIHKLAHWASVVVDVIGIGAGVVDKLRSDGIPAIAFNAAERTDLTDASGELGFLNCRSASWWMMREILDPANGVLVALPPDDILTGDLCAPKYRVAPGGKIVVEAKDEIKKRIGRSTDAADAVIMALVGDIVAMGNAVQRQVIYNPVRI